MNECLWPPLKQPLLPAADEVLLLSVPLDVDAKRIAQFRSTFSPREQQRAARYATDELRNRWVAGRGLLRELLAAALGGTAGEIAFTYGAHGKPALDPWSAPSPADGGPPLTFNVSHSRGRGLYALGRGRKVGVDLEEMRARKSDGVANRFFAAGESASLRAIEDELARRRSFFFIWSAKEAFIKATGAGLSQSLSSFEFALDTIAHPLGSAFGDERVLVAPFAVQSHVDDAEAHARWSVHPCSPAQGFSGCLVAEGTPRAVALRQWDSSVPLAALSG